MNDIASAFNSFSNLQLVQNPGIAGWPPVSTKVPLYLTNWDRGSRPWLDAAFDF
jgi:hypothetical protein